MICNKCFYNARHPFGITYDKDQVCSGCFTHQEKYSLDWRERENTLRVNLEKILKNKKSKFDCLISVIGDAEDYHTVNKVLELGLNPLLVGVNDYFYNDIGWHNLHNLITHFDLDSFIFNPEIYAYKELIKTSLRKYNHALWPSFSLKTSFPVHVAIQRKIPLIIFGQNQQIEQVGKYSHLENTEMTAWSRVEHDLFGIDLDDILGSGGHINILDHPYYIYPPIKKLGKGRLIGIYLSNFFAWDPLFQNSNTMKFGFMPQSQNSTFDPYERAGSSIYYSFHDLTKYLRTGYRKITDHVNREIRHGRVSRSEGKLIISSFSNQKVFIKDFFNWLDVSKSGYQWFKEHRLKDALHLIAEDKQELEEVQLKLPNKLQKLIFQGQSSKSDYQAFLKGIRL